MDGGVVVAALACALVACTGPQPDYGDTHYACSDGDPCPDGQACVGGVCRGIATLGIDASDPTAPDAAHFTIRRDGAPHVEIPDNDPAGVEDSVDVPACEVAGTAVEVKVTHPWRGDVTLELHGPNGETILLKQYEDADSVNDVEGTYPDTLDPEESLDQLVGGEGEGTWALQAADLDSDDVGTFDTWALVLDCV